MLSYRIPTELWPGCVITKREAVAILFLSRMVDLLAKHTVCYDRSGSGICKSNVGACGCGAVHATEFIGIDIPVLKFPLCSNFCKDDTGIFSAVPSSGTPRSNRDNHEKDNKI